MSHPSRRPSLERLEDRRLLSGYTFTDLSSLGDAGSFRVNDVNNAGQVVGVSGGHAFIWQAGAMTDLGTLGGATSEAVSINSHGDVVGSAATSDGTVVPFLWKDGVMTSLRLGAGAEAVAINDSDQVAANFNSRALLWQNGAVTDLGELFPGGGAGAADINNAGQIVGASYSGLAGALGFPVSHTYRWQNGVMTDLGAPTYTQGSYPAAVNNVGQVAGSTSIFVNTGYGMAFLANSFFYDGTNMISLPVASLQNLATDVNDAGQVVGTGGGRAYLYEGGVVKDLNTLVPVGTPGLSSASAINNAGQILGYTSSGRGFLLTPDRPPVPGTEWIVDDGTPDFAISGARAGISSEGYLGDSRRLAPTSRTLGSRRMLLSDRFRSAATWSFAGLEPGTYRVTATWPAGADRASNAPYTISNGANSLTTVLVNQRGAPNDLAAAGVGWKNLGTFTIGSGGLSVRLTNQTNGWALADAVRVEKVTATAAAADAVTPAPTRSTPLALRRTAFELLA